MLSNVRTPDGRVLDVLAAASGDVPLVYHSGTPTAAVANPDFEAAAAAHGLRLVTWSRPGYATSTPQPGRTVASVAADTATVLDALGADRFLTVGWSGGGPHALACAALLPARCLAAATVAGVAPWHADGLDWLAGMGAENIEEFGAAAAGGEHLTRYLEAAAEQLVDVTADQLAESLGDLAAAADVATFHGAFGDWQAAVFRKAVSTGIAGWRDDDLAIITDWGVDLADIARPVRVWQGDVDRMVPGAHGRWIAAARPRSGTAFSGRARATCRWSPATASPRSSTTWSPSPGEEVAG